MVDRYARHSFVRYAAIRRLGPGEARAELARLDDLILRRPGVLVTAGGTGGGPAGNHSGAGPTGFEAAGAADGPAVVCAPRT